MNATAEPTATPLSQTKLAVLRALNANEGGTLRHSVLAVQVATYRSFDAAAVSERAHLNAVEAFVALDALNAENLVHKVEERGPNAEATEEWTISPHGKAALASLGL